MGRPEPWAPVLAPTLTSLGISMNWVCWDLGGPMSFPTLKFGKVVPPPDGRWSLSSCPLLGATAVTSPVSLSHTPSPGAMAFMDLRGHTAWPGGLVGTGSGRAPSKWDQAQTNRQCGRKRNDSHEVQALGWGHAWSH